MVQDRTGCTTCVLEGWALKVGGETFFCRSCVRNLGEWNVTLDGGRVTSSGSSTVRLHQEMQPASWDSHRCWKSVDVSIAPWRFVASRCRNSKVLGGLDRKPLCLGSLEKVMMFYEEINHFGRGISQRLARMKVDGNWNATCVSGFSFFFYIVLLLENWTSFRHHFR